MVTYSTAKVSAQWRHYDARHIIVSVHHLWCALFTKLAQAKCIVYEFILQKLQTIKNNQKNEHIELVVKFCFC